MSEAFDLFVNRPAETPVKPLFPRRPQAATVGHISISNLSKYYGAHKALEAAITGRATGLPVYLVGGFAKGGVQIVGRPDLNIKGIADLKGKKVGVTRGGPQEILLFAELTAGSLLDRRHLGQRPL